MPATLAPLGDRALMGPLRGLWGVGPLLAGVVVARIGAGARPAATTGRIARRVGDRWPPATGPASLGALLLLGRRGDRAHARVRQQHARRAPAGTPTEAFTQTTVGMTAGIAAGAALAGVIVEAASPSLAFAALGGGGQLAAVLVRAAAPGPLRETVLTTSQPTCSYLNEG